MKCLKCGNCSGGYYQGPMELSWVECKNVGKADMGASNKGAAAFLRKLAEDVEAGTSSALFCWTPGFEGRVAMCSIAWRSEYYTYFSSQDPGGIVIALDKPHVPTETCPSCACPADQIKAIGGLKHHMCGHWTGRT